jgi:hypothetical protein
MYACFGDKQDAASRKKRRKTKEKRESRHPPNIKALAPLNILLMLWLVLIFHCIFFILELCVNKQGLHKTRKATELEKNTMRYQCMNIVIVKIPVDRFIAWWCCTFR